MALLPKLFALAALGTVSALSFGQAITGNWNGHVDLSSLNIPKGANPQQQQMIAKQIAMVKAMVVKLNIKPNKTFTMSAKGGMTPKPIQDEGVWSRTGNSLSLKLTKRDGKPTQGGQSTPFTLTIAANNKSLTLIPPGGAAQGKLIFTR